MNRFFYFKAGSSSNYRIKVDETFIFNAYTLTFYLCGLTTAAYFSPSDTASLPHYLLLIATTRFNDW